MTINDKLTPKQIEASLRMLEALSSAPEGSRVEDMALKWKVELGDVVWEWSDQLKKGSLGPGSSVAHVAAGVGQVSALNEALKRGCPVDSRWYRGSTLLMEAAQNREWDAVWELLEAGASLNAQDEQGMTALMKACGHREQTSKPAIRALERMVRESDLSQKDHEGKSAFEWAARSGDAELLELMDKKEPRDQERLWELMLEAIEARQEEPVLWLVKKGCPMVGEGRDGARVDAMMLAVANLYFEKESQWGQLIEARGALSASEAIRAGRAAGFALAKGDERGALAAIGWVERMAPREAIAPALAACVSYARAAEARRCESRSRKETARRIQGRWWPIRRSRECGIRS